MGTNIDYRSVGHLREFEDIIKKFKDYESFDQFYRDHFSRGTVVSDGLANDNNWGTEENEVFEISPSATRSWVVPEPTRDEIYPTFAVGGGGSDWLIGNDYSNTLVGDNPWSGDPNDSGPADGNDSIYGLGGDDFLFGGGGDDFIDGGTGNDIMRGGIGQDVLLGGTGSDIIYGNKGNDLLIGGIDGAQYLGGSGQDTFLVHQTPGFGFHKIWDMKDDKDVTLIDSTGFREGWRIEIDDTDLSAQRLNHLQDNDQLVWGGPVENFAGFGVARMNLICNSTQMEFASIEMHQGMAYYFDQTGIQAQRHYDSSASPSVNRAHAPLIDTWDLI